MRVGGPVEGPLMRVGGPVEGILDVVEGEARPFRQRLDRHHPTLRTRAATTAVTPSRYT